MAKEKILLTIAARGGSKGVKNKNIRTLCGKPLIAYTIEQAKQWGKADHIICSTDSENIAQVARQYGAEVPFVRPSELATDEAGKLDVLRHALIAYEKQTGKDFSVVVDLDVTAPIRKISDIEGAYQLFLARRPQIVFSVTKARRNPYFNMVEVEENGQASLAKKLPTVVKRRQDAPKVYDMNASIYVYDRAFLLDQNSKSAVANNSFVWLMDELSAFDIDAELDFKYVEYLINNKVVSL